MSVYFPTYGITATDVSVVILLFFLVLSIVKTIGTIINHVCAGTHDVAVHVITATVIILLLVWLKPNSRLLSATWDSPVLHTVMEFAESYTNFLFGLAKGLTKLATK